MTALVLHRVVLLRGFTAPHATRLLAATRPPPFPTTCRQCSSFSTALRCRRPSPSSLYGAAAQQPVALPFRRIARLGMASSSSPHDDGGGTAPMDPQDVVIPLDKLEFSFARSSGPGGQNVNKLNTKAEVRFNVFAADWLPFEVKQRLAQQQANKINNDGELLVTSQEHRTQNRNKEDCIDKLRVMLAEAYVEPKERSMWEGISEKGKQERKQEKRKRGAVKQSRTSNRKFDYDD